MKNKEVRTVEFRLSQDKESNRIVGHAAVFNEWADMYGLWREKIAPGAFDETLDADVRALFNHDSNFVLGRTKAGTLKLSVDDRGLVVDIEMPDTQWARDLKVSMQRGDVTQMSFGFYVVEETWEETDESTMRTIEKVELFDVSVVTYPAYKGTDASVRNTESYEKMKKQRAARRAARAKRLLSLYEMEGD